MTTPEQPTTYTIDPGTRLVDLLAAYAELKPRADEATARLKAVTDAIKAELTAAAPGATRMRVGCADLPQDLQLTYVQRWRVDAKRLKEENPALYVAYAVQDNRWELRAVSS